MRVRAGLEGKVKRAGRVLLWLAINGALCSTLALGLLGRGWAWGVFVAMFWVMVSAAFLIAPAMLLIVHGELKRRFSVGEGADLLPAVPRFMSVAVDVCVFFALAAYGHTAMAIVWAAQMFCDAVVAVVVKTAKKEAEEASAAGGVA